MPVYHAYVPGSFWPGKRHRVSLLVWFVTCWRRSRLQFACEVSQRGQLEEWTRAVKELIYNVILLFVLDGCCMPFAVLLGRCAAAVVMQPAARLREVGVCRPHEPRVMSVFTEAP